MSAANPEVAPLDDDYIGELNEAYNHFFFHYTATPLLVVETSQFDLSWGEDALADLERQLRSMGKGTRYYVPGPDAPRRAHVAVERGERRWYMLQ